MRQAATMLRAAEQDLEWVRTRLDELLWSAPWPAHDDDVAPARAAALDAAAALAEASRRAADAAVALEVAAQRYAAAEEAVEQGVRVAAAASAAAWGRGLTLALFGGPLAVTGFVATSAGVAGGAIGLALMVELIRDGRIDPALDPVLLAGLRVALGSVDDAVRGALGVETVRYLTADDATAPFSTAALAAAAAGALRLVGASVGTSTLEVKPSGASRAVAAPGGIGDLVARIPGADPGAPQVRIERYGTAEQTRWIVYITGTVDFGPVSGDEPFDLRSNLQGVAGPDSDSIAAVLAAMRAAGVAKGEPVLYVGHSQGGLDALRLAGSSEFTAAGVVSVGGPTGSISAPTGVPVLEIVHDQDPVPALVGIPIALTADRVVVRRSLPAAATTGTGTAVPSHDLATYRGTARALDGVDSAAVREATARLALFTAPAAGAASAWRIDRRAATNVSGASSRTAAG